MNSLSTPLLLLPLCLAPAWIHAADTGLQVEEAEVGGHLVSLTFDDSVVTPDLSSLRIEGYGLAAAAFVEESDSLSLSPDLWDLTLPGSPRLLQRDANDSLSFLLEVPSDWTLKPGVLLSDTALGGVLVKVLSFAPAGNVANRFWIKTQPAFFNDAVLEGEIRFKVRMDLNTILGDRHFEGASAGSDSGEIDWKGDLRNGKMLFQPVLTGVLRVHNGLLEKMAFHLQGALEIDAAFDATVRGAGAFIHTDSLPESQTLSIPLGHGFCLRIAEGFSLSEEARGLEDSLTAWADPVHVRQALDADLGFQYNHWQPAVEVSENSPDKPRIGAQGNGSFGWALQPQFRFSLGVAPGPLLTVSPLVRVAPTPADSTAPDTAAPGLKAGQAWLRDALFLNAPPVAANADPDRDFLLFNRERVWISPPLQGWAQITGGDSASVFLQCQTEPPADYFIVQRLNAAGAWETVLPRAVGNRLRVTGLPAGLEQHFRLIGVNAYGAGTAFPPGGLAYTPPVPQPLPLPVPVPVQPDSEVRSDTGVRLSWESPAPSHPDGVFNVYLGIRFSHLEPVAQSLRDTTFLLTQLDSGRTYFWKVEYVEGTRFSEGPIRWFTYATIRPAHPPVPAPAPPVKGMVYLPGGSFQRSDGYTVVVGPFYIQPFEVIQKDYRRVMGDNPSYHAHDSLPVERVTWDEADQYCRDIGGRLPTEAEWEYAARGGVAGPFYWGRAPATDYAHFRENSDDHTWQVGSLKPNAYGLYDMAGNVFEWTHDWYGPYSQDDLVNPKGPSTGEAKVIRGGSWYSEGQSLDLSARFSNRPGFRNYKVGFRCAKSAPVAVAGADR